LTLVVDATVTIASVGSAEGFKALADDDLVAPALMWSEARSTLHLGLLNGKVSAQHANLQHDRLESCPVRRVDDAELGRVAWRIAEQFGWGRTYDAEYVALAQDSPLPIGDARRASAPGHGPSRLRRHAG
jgi:predicted nucleic acid-binding protein